MAKRELIVYLNDILESIIKIEEYLNGISASQFENNFEKQDAVIRRFEIIGEAVKQIPIDLRNKYPDIPWRNVAGLRDIVIHSYFGVSSELIWRAAKEDIPSLKETIQKMITDLKSSPWI
jgi:uncharacterized protein with HEPN domain